MLAAYSLEVLLIAALVMVCAGIVKGISGFALPLIAVTLIGTFISFEVAIQAMLLPTLVTNGYQAVRQGKAEAWISLKKHKTFMGVLALVLICTAQLVTAMDESLLFILLGILVLVFVATRLGGFKPEIPENKKGIYAVVLGAIGGFFGGLSGSWGPPTVIYLIGLRVEKYEMIRLQGIIYFLGCLFLTLAHLKTGILNEESILFSVLMVVPAFIGQSIGLKIQDKLDQERFLHFVLIVLLLIGVNLMRKGLLT